MKISVNCSFCKYITAAIQRLDLTTRKCNTVFFQRRSGNKLQISTYGNTLGKHWRALPSRISSYSAWTPSGMMTASAVPQSSPAPSTVTSFSLSCRNSRRQSFCTAHLFDHHWCTHYCWLLIKHELLHPPLLHTKKWSLPKLAKLCRLRTSTLSSVCLGLTSEKLTAKGIVPAT